ncbi:questin oxidase family protein [Acrocarpospora catenulata]|uniref:questin oxidase family protein n=1 Tax=Acrocarpospora catenulata TaxID=2836182 RepID=UPI001BD92119|nr:questin oxidase family protein [Acrocarpospora catenulata]
MDQLDEALVRLADTGPEFHGGLSNHGPMVAEALVRLGAPEMVPGWISAYLPKLDDQPGTRERITDWRDALGDKRRIGDWTAYFTAALAESPWREVLAQWWPRLTPGLAAGATHGVIRTAHAVRAVADQETEPRQAELAHALAYWAAAYVELPGRPLTAGVRTMEQAVAVLPILELAPRSLIVSHLGNLKDLPEFANAVSALRPPSDVRADLSELSRVFSGVFLTHARHAPIPFTHAVTMPIAVSSILHHLPQETWRPTYDRIWQMSAALYSGYAYQGTVEPPPSADPSSPKELAGQAAETGEEHAIKLTEAVLRQHTITGDPVFLHTAARAIEVLGG